MEYKDIEIDGVTFSLTIRKDYVGFLAWVYTAWLTNVKGVIVQERRRKDIEESIRTSYRVKKEYERNRKL